MKKTALHDTHVKLGGRIVDFAGWALPVQYASMITEHKAVREDAGVFDCSHMGQFFIKGPEAYDFVQYMITNNLDKVGPGRGLYSGLLYDNGTFVDDIIVYVQSKESIFIVVNASNIDKDYAWFHANLEMKGYKCTLTNRSDEFSLLAVQGPKAPEFVEQFFPGVYGKLDTFGHAELTYQGALTFICRTGYTGEAGVEIILENKSAPALLEALVAAGVTPCGLGSRDTLRLEKGFSLYGHEINDTTNALEAGLGWVCDLSKPAFIGKDALVKIKADGVKRKLIGFTVEDRPIPRDGEKIVDADGNEIGYVTSGTMSPILNKGIGLAYVPVTCKDATINIATKRKTMIGTVCKRTFV